MKSTEVYKTINANLSSSLKEKGFKRTKSGMLGYYKPITNYELYFWFQCSRDGFDKLFGNKFTVQFAIAKKNDVPFGGIDGGRIPKYMLDDDFDKINELQNSVISGLPVLPKDFFIYNEELTKYYLSKFTKINASYTNTSDIWFRYFNSTDVEKWVQFLFPIIFKTLNLLEEKHK